MGDVIRYGIIGAGMMGLEHLRNLALVPDAIVTTLADPVEDSRNWARLVAGDATIFSDYRDLLASGSVDAVVIASPNHTHIDVLRDLFETDLHVLVEKPLCTTLEDCREVERSAARHAGVVQVGLEYRYMPPVARLIEEVRKGSAGPLRMLAIREHRFPFLPKVGDWNRFNRNTGGTLVEKCCHFFDLMHLIVGERPVSVFASGAQDVNHLDERYDGEVPDILDNAYVIVDFASGTRALLDLCMFAEASRHEQEICATGDLGKVECFIPEGTVVIGRREGRKVETHPIALDEEVRRAGFHHGATYYEHLAFARAIRERSAPEGERGAPEVTVSDGLWSVATGIAAQQSIAGGRPVELAELGLGSPRGPSS